MRTKELIILATWLGLTLPLFAQPPTPPALDVDISQQPAEEDRRDSAISREIEHLRLMLEIQQKQLEALKGLTEATATQVVEQPASVASESMEEDIERLKAASRQAAHRDEEVAYELDRVNEDLDGISRNGAPLPSTLRELFLPSRFDQSPIVMYNTLQTGFTDLEGEHANFTAPTWLPHFYMLFREDYQLQLNPQINSESFELLSAQVDWFVRDDLTLTAGRFYSPLGFFNERLHTSWVLKTPDDPMIFEVIYPHQLSMNGLQFRGAKYIADLPVKLEYCGFTSNGLSLDRDSPTEKDYADFRLMRKSFTDVNQDKAFGGRLGLSFPQIGLVCGASGMLNGAYDVAGEQDLSLVDYDASLHNGNWDLKFEYVDVSQQAPRAHIDRQGFYFQTAYRDYSSIHPFWGNVEYLFRFCHVEFNGIDLGLTGFDFGDSDHIPVDRNRYTLGGNYYFSPSLVSKLAFEINDELSQAEFDDNGILAQLSWGF